MNCEVPPGQEPPQPITPEELQAIRAKVQDLHNLCKGLGVTYLIAVDPNRGHVEHGDALPGIGAFVVHGEGCRLVRMYQNMPGVVLRLAGTDLLFEPPPFSLN